MVNFRNRSQPRPLDQTNALWCRPRRAGYGPPLSRRNDIRTQRRRYQSLTARVFKTGRYRQRRECVAAYPDEAGWLIDTLPIAKWRLPISKGGFSTTGLFKLAINNRHLAIA